MPEPGTDARVARGRLAALTRHRALNDPDVDAARRDLRVASAEDYIRRLVDAAPPLTDDQRSRLALLLRPQNGSGA